MEPNCSVARKRKPVRLPSVSVSIYMISIHADSRVAAVGCDDVTRGPGGLGSLSRQIDPDCLLVLAWVARKETRSQWCAEEIYTERHQDACFTKRMS